MPPTYVDPSRGPIFPRSKPLNFLDGTNNLSDNLISSLVIELADLRKIEKVEILKECGVTISKNPSVMGDTVKSVLEKM